LVCAVPITSTIAAFGKLAHFPGVHNIKLMARLVGGLGSAVEISVQKGSDGVFLPVYRDWVTAGFVSTTA
jgi:hypothetical protein